VWIERNPAEEGKEAKKPDQAALDKVAQDEMLKIRKHVATLLPPVEGVNDSSELVTVTPFQDIKLPPPPLPAMSEKAMTWFGQHWSTVGLLVLALLALMMLKSMLRVAPALPPTPAGATAHAEENEQPGETPQAVATRRLRRFQGTGRSLVDELSELVQEDPDVAANILKSWVSQVN
jgi:flagellar M-ring protein FliF